MVLLQLGVNFPIILGESSNTVTQIGMLKTLGAIAVYSALIHERDHAARNRAPKPRKDAVGRNV